MVAAVRELLTVLAIFAYLVYLNTLLTVLALVTVPLIFWLMHAAQRPLRRFSHEVQGSIAGLTTTAKEALDAPRTVRAYNAKSYRKELFGAAGWDGCRSSARGC